MNQEILSFCIEKGILLDKQVLKNLENLENLEIVKNLIEKIKYQYKQHIITKSFFEDKEIVKKLIKDYNNIDKKIIESLLFNLGVDIGELDKLNEETQIFDNQISKLPQVISIKNYINNPRKLAVSDFVKNFRNRFNFIRGVLQDRSELGNLISIGHIEQGKQFSLIGLVFDKKVTKNGNVLLEIEDLTGKTIALINKTKLNVFEKSKEILLDEVIGLKCSGNKEIVFVNDIIFPDIHLIKKKKSKKPEIIAFTSDFHVGSDKFLENSFLKFIDWLNGELGDEKQKKEALSVKYLFITGDSIDGVGIYPGQESQLIIKDINGQYSRLGELLSKIRSNIEIILCPGQHDAVRIAEPQPIIGESYAPSLYMLKNLHLVTNPAVIEIGNDIAFKILMYHGASMHGIINSIESLRLGKGHDSPTEVVKYMLKKRHLAPTHSLVTYTPLEGEDSLLIKDIPDIVATGDLHRPEISEYNNILLIASSCWQSKTPFEEKVGNNPDPCKVPIFNMKTREIKILDFSEVEEDKDEEENKEREK